MRRLLIGLLVVVALVFVALAAFDRLAPHTAAAIAVDLERSRSGLKAARLDVDGIDIAYLHGGEGETILLMHGFGADKDNFTRIAASLTPNYRVLIPDLPGFGESGKAMDVDYGIAEQMERMRAFVRAHGAERVHLGGSSMGGWISVEWALQYPGEVASLWLLGPAGTRTAVAFDSDAAPEDNPLLAQSPQDYARIMDFVMSRPPFLPYSVRHVLAERAVGDFALHARIFAQISDEQGHPTPAQDDRLQGLETPALVVWGEDDQVLSVDATALYASAMPNAEVVRLPGIGHLPMLEAPRRTADDYLSFLDGLR